MKRFFKRLKLIDWFRVFIAALLVTLMASVLFSCSPSKYFTEKAYICYDVYKTWNGEYVHKFANLTATEGRDFYFDSVYCKPFDTIDVKEGELQ